MSSLARPRQHLRRHLAALTFLALAATACSDDPTEPVAARRAPSALYDKLGNPILVVGSTVPGVARLEVTLRGEGIRDTRLVFGNERPYDDAWGAVPVPRGTKSLLVLRGFDSGGRERFAGELAVAAEGDVVSQVRTAVKVYGGATNRPAEAYAGSYRVALSTIPGIEEGEIAYGLVAHDARGGRLAVSPADITPWPQPEPGTLDVTYGARELRELVLRMHPEIPDEERKFVPLENVCIFGSVACGLPPVEIYTKVVVEGWHTCALKSTGVARCWGDDGEEILGGTATINRLASKRFTDIDTHAQHSCGIDGMGVVWCWGQNPNYQLGNTGGSTAIPQAVAHPKGGRFRKVAVGLEHTCATDEANAVWCWGERNFGQLGDSNLTWGVPARATPFEVPGITGKSIDAGDYHTCVVTIYDTVACWGYNGSMQLLGDYAYGRPGCSVWTCASPVFPVDYSGNYLNRGIVAVSAGGRGTCAVEGTGTLWCWGQIHAGGGYPYNYGVQVVDAGQSFVSAAHGKLSNCALTTSGIARCFGHDGHGELGRGVATPSTYGLAPGSVVAPPAAFSSLAAGGEHACGISKDGLLLLCWGHTGLRLGFANTTDVPSPTAVTVF